MRSRPELRLDWCSHAAAKYAVEHWHYSRSLPSGATVKVGVWEDVQYIGCVIFAMGATPNLAKHHQLPQTAICELARVALREHASPVSRIVRVALQYLRARCPGIRLVVSFADADQGHYGGIYQAGGWLYLGLSNPGGSQGFIVRGRPMHRRSVGSAGWSQSLAWLRAHVDPAAQALRTAGKFKYAMPLDADMRARMLPLAQPYPKRPCATSSAGAAPGVQPGEGGSTPTVALLEVIHAP